MPDFVYSPSPVLVETTGNFAIGATGVLRPAGGGAPVPLYDLNGIPLASVIVGPKGAHQAFKADISNGILDFGSVLLPAISDEARVAALEVREAVEAASAAAGAAQASAAASATSASASRDVTDAAVAALVSGEQTATGAAVKALAGAILVIHGANAATARPAFVGPVVWFGSVTPSNWVDGDVQVPITPYEG